MARQLQRGQLRRHRKKITGPNSTTRDTASAPCLSPFKAFLIVLLAIVGVIEVFDIPSVSIQLETAKMDSQAGTAKSSSRSKESQSNDAEGPPTVAQEEKQPDTSQQEAAEEAPNSAVTGPLLMDEITDPWKRGLYRRLDRYREECGSLCGVNDMDSYKAIANPQEGTAYSTFQIPVDCTKLFELDEHDDEDFTVPFPIPEELEPFFSLNGAITVNNWKRFQGSLTVPEVDFKKMNVKLGGRAMDPTWTLDEIDRGIDLVKHGELKGSYGVEETNRVFNKVKEQGGLEDKVVLVIGSEKSWLETVALAAGAKSVLTVEYLKIRSLHPKVRTIRPADFRTKYLEGELPLFDAVLSYSSLDHSGLGRYGDALNPWSDVVSLARCWCTTRDDGMLMLALPTGQDEVKFNAHRIYGNIRWPLMTANWQPIDEVTDFTKKEIGKDEAIHFFRKLPNA